MKQISNTSSVYLTSLQGQKGSSAMFTSPVKGTIIFITLTGVCMHISSTHYCHSGFICLP